MGSTLSALIVVEGNLNYIGTTLINSSALGPPGKNPHEDLDDWVQRVCRIRSMDTRQFVTLSVTLTTGHLYLLGRGGLVWSFWCSLAAV